jgi:polar amino acid transport system substrate-binding protein
MIISRANRGLLGALAVGLLAACGGAAAPPASTSASLNGSLPAAIRQAGVITVATYPGHPPNNFLAPDGSTVIGVDASIREVLAKELGVQFRVLKISGFNGLIPALLSGRADMIMSGMSDTRQREQQVSFVDYLEVGSSILAQGGNPLHITGPESLCGRSVAVTAGPEMESQSAKCRSEGRPPVAVTQFPTNTEAVLQVRNQRAAATITDYPVAVYEAQHANGALSVAGQPFNTGPYGIAFRRDDAQLQAAVQKAVQTAIDNGGMSRALRQWGVSSAIPKQARLNGAPA